MVRVLHERGPGRFSVAPSPKKRTLAVTMKHTASINIPSALGGAALLGLVLLATSAAQGSDAGLVVHSGRTNQGDSRSAVSVSTSAFSPAVSRHPAEASTFARI